ncbi:MAG TPA: copper-containing nitrite reductase, partial [Trueperaceae bacterium]|nr:copper-containing nitrite reductase [Trueperaceae bacterium]
APPAEYLPNVSYTLTTGLASGRMAFIGVGGTIDGIANPDLIAQPGQVVQITLVNGDNVAHDIFVDQFANAHSAIVDRQGGSTTIVFRADIEGTFDYWCTIPGHRQAGMEGNLIVGEVVSEFNMEELTHIVRPPDALPGPLEPRSEPMRHEVVLATVERTALLADGITYRFWTFNGLIPGPFIRVKVGDTVDVMLENPADSKFIHSVDLHAVTGPGGGAVSTQTLPGNHTGFTFKALNPGLYIYHCATPMVAHHISNGMYGMILVEPEGGLPAVDREFYVMQAELYTTGAFGEKGLQEFAVEKLLDEDPEYYTFNGAVNALNRLPLRAEVGETVRIFFGVGGPNKISSFHVIGEIFDRVYHEGSVTAEPLTNIHVTTVPAGGTVIVDFKVEVPGDYTLVDHALSRAERGLAGTLVVTGEPNPEIYDGEILAPAGH